jgi:hypothetical protein
VTPFFGIAKELDVRFAFGYDPQEFTASLRSIAEGEIDAAAMVTAEVGLDRVGWAFDALGDPDEHCKIIVTPSPPAGSSLSSAAGSASAASAASAESAGPAGSAGSVAGSAGPSSAAGSAGEGAGR